MRINVVEAHSYNHLPPQILSKVIQDFGISYQDLSSPGTERYYILFQKTPGNYGEPWQWVFHYSRPGLAIKKALELMETPGVLTKIYARSV